MLKNKSIDYIFGMITGISVSITFWACTNTDLIASNDASVESNTVQQVEITNWSSMPDVKISSSGNNVDIGNWSSMPSGGTVTFPSSIDVHLKSVPSGGFDVDIGSFPTYPYLPVDIKGFPINHLGVDIESVPYSCCN